MEYSEIIKKKAKIVYLYLKVYAIQLINDEKNNTTVELEFSKDFFQNQNQKFGHITL